MNKEPEALSIANHLETKHLNFRHIVAAAAELRRLHAVNADLLVALKHAAEHAYWTDIEQQLYAAIAKAEGEQK